MIDLSKSPMNFSGNKFYVMDAIRKCFPENINMFVDLFCGGCDVVSNVEAKKKIANDKDSKLIGIFRAFQETDDVVSCIEKIVEENRLTKSDDKAFEKFKAKYNKSKDPLELYALLCFSRNYTMKFERGKYTASLGKGRNSFNSSMKKNLEEFLVRIKDIEFSDLDFRKFSFDSLSGNDILYCDPPNIFLENGWKQKDMRDLFAILDGLSKRGVRFALSVHSSWKGEETPDLYDWICKGYLVHAIEDPTNEILVTNY